MSRKESVIVVEAEKALEPAARRRVGRRLPRSGRSECATTCSRSSSDWPRCKVEQITQGIEEDIIAALEETIAALQKAQKDSKKRKPKPRPAGEPAEEPPLVDKIAEMKMIRSMQMRVNNRTKRYSRMLKETSKRPSSPNWSRRSRGSANANSGSTRSRATSSSGGTNDDDVARASAHADRRVDERAAAWAC